MRLSAFYTSASPVAPVIISIALMLFFGFAMTRVTRKLKLPDVTAYILSGILIGPCGMDLIPPNVVSGTEFLPDIALAFIAFSTGEFFRLSTLRKNGWRVVLVTVLEAVMASAFVFVLTFWVLNLTLPFSVVLSALAAATAPASTMMTIRQTGARGDFVDTFCRWWRWTTWWGWSAIPSPYRWRWPRSRAERARFSSKARRFRWS